MNGSAPPGTFGEPTSAIVLIESAWLSKINWAAIVSLVAAILSVWGVAFPPEAQDAVLKLIYAVSNAITVLGPIAVMIFRTFFSKTVTPQSVSNAPPVIQTETVASQTPPGGVVNAVDARDW